MLRRGGGVLRRTFSSFENRWKRSDLRRIAGVGPVNEKLLLEKDVNTVRDLLSTFSETFDKDERKFSEFLSETVGIKHHVQKMVDYIQAESIIRDRIGVSRHEASSPLSRRLTFCVEGNISVGKSTFLNRIVKENEKLSEVTDIVPEPVEKWQDCTHESVGGLLRDPSWDEMMLKHDNDTQKEETHNILNAFYQDPARHAYTFQTYVFIKRVLQSYNTVIGERPFRLMERSVFSDQMIFVRAVHESKFMTDLELNLFRSWFDPVVSQLPGMVPDGFVYLRASPETCLKRMHVRNRSEESGVPLEYLQQLHRNHEEWFEGTTKASSEVPVEIRDSVLHLTSPSTHSAIRNLPILVLDCDVEIDFETSESSEHRKRLTEQLEAYFSYVKSFHVERESNKEETVRSYYPPILNWDSKETQVMMSVFASEAKRRGYDTDSVVRR